MNIFIREALIEENIILECICTEAATYGCKILQLYEYEGMNTDTKQSASNTPRIPVKVVRNKNLKILIIDNFFSCHLMVIKFCTVIELGNT